MELPRGRDRSCVCGMSGGLREEGGIENRAQSGRRVRGAWEGLSGVEGLKEGRPQLVRLCG